jgi:hypothetical protein
MPEPSKRPTLNASIPAPQLRFIGRAISGESSKDGRACPSSAACKLQQSAHAPTAFYAESTHNAPLIAWGACTLSASNNEHADQTKRRYDGKWRPSLTATSGYL